LDFKLFVVILLDFKLSEMYKLLSIMRLPSILVFFLFFIILLLVDQINFPSPNKKIEKIIPNENLKVIK